MIRRTRATRTKGPRGTFHEGVVETYHPETQSSETAVYIFFFIFSFFNPFDDDDDDASPLSGGTY